MPTEEILYKLPLYDGGTPGNGAGISREKARNERQVYDSDTIEFKNEKSVDNFQIR